MVALFPQPRQDRAYSCDKDCFPLSSERQIVFGSSLSP